MAKQRLIVAQTSRNKLRLKLIFPIAFSRGYTLEELESVRAEKAEKRGGFEKKIFLIETNEK